MKRKFFAIPVFVGMSLFLTPSFAPAQVPGVPQDPNNEHGGTDNGNGNNGQNNGVNKNTDAPFDIGVGILIAAGAAIALKKANDSRKKKAVGV